MGFILPGATRVLFPDKKLKTGTYPVQQRILPHTAVVTSPVITSQHTAMGSRIAAAPVSSVTPSLVSPILTGPYISTQERAKAAKNVLTSVTQPQVGPRLLPKVVARPVVQKPIQLPTSYITTQQKAQAGAAAQQAVANQNRVGPVAHVFPKPVGKPVVTTTAKAPPFWSNEAKTQRAAEAQDSLATGLDHFNKAAEIGLTVLGKTIEQATGFSWTKENWKWTFDDIARNTAGIWGRQEELALSALGRAAGNTLNLAGVAVIAWTTSKAIITTVQQTANAVKAINYYNEQLGTWKEPGFTEQGTLSKAGIAQAAAAPGEPIPGVTQRLVGATEVPGIAVSRAEARSWIDYVVNTLGGTKAQAQEILNIWKQPWTEPGPAPIGQFGMPKTSLGTTTPVQIPSAGPANVPLTGEELVINFVTSHPTAAVTLGLVENAQAVNTIAQLSTRIYAGSLDGAQAMMTVTNMIRNFTALASAASAAQAAVTKQIPAAQQVPTVLTTTPIAKSTVAPVGRVLPRPQAATTQPIPRAVDAPTGYQGLMDYSEPVVQPTVRPAPSATTEPWQMTSDERQSKIAALQVQYKRELATPLMSEGNISPMQVGQMSKNQLTRFQQDGQTKFVIEAQIQDLEHPELAKVRFDQNVVAKHQEQITALQSRLGVLQQFGQRKNGMMRPSYQKEIDKVQTQLDTLVAPKAVVTPAPLEKGPSAMISQPQVSVSIPTEATAPVVAPATKEPWQMTLDEIRATGTIGYDTKTGRYVFTSGVSRIAPDSNAHYQSVRKALAEGNSIPPEVLADYPDLKATAPAAVTLGTPAWEGTAYRADTGFSNRGATAADVIRFERDELGNDMPVSDELMAQLDKMPAKNVVWVTKIKADAEVYGEPEEYSLPANSRILAEDGDGGYLVLKGDAVPVAQVAAVTPAEADKLGQPLADIYNKAIKDEARDQAGQSILDAIDARGDTPQHVSDEFWTQTYPALPPELQQKFEVAVVQQGGFKVGDVIGTNADGSKVVAHSFKDLADAVDLGNDATALQGTERGYVALMDRATQVLNGTAQAEPIPEKTAIAPGTDASNAAQDLLDIGTETAQDIKTQNTKQAARDDKISKKLDEQITKVDEAIDLFHQLQAQLEQATKAVAPPEKAPAVERAPTPEEVAPPVEEHKTVRQMKGGRDWIDAKDNLIRLPTPRELVNFLIRKDIVLLKDFFDDAFLISKEEKMARARGEEPKAVLATGKPLFGRLMRNEATPGQKKVGPDELVGILEQYGLEFPPTMPTETPEDRLVEVLYQGASNGAGASQYDYTNQPIHPKWNEQVLAEQEAANVEVPENVPFNEQKAAVTPQGLAAAKAAKLKRAVERTRQVTEQQATKAAVEADVEDLFNSLNQTGTPTDADIKGLFEEAIVPTIQTNRTTEEIALLATGQSTPAMRNEEAQRLVSLHEQDVEALQRATRTAVSIHYPNGAKVIGLKISPNLIAGGTVKIKGQHITGPQDIAALSQPVRSPIVEQTLIVYVRNGIGIHVEVRTLHLPGASMVVKVENSQQDVNEIAAFARSIGADEIWLVHNHPTGDPRPSKNDWGSTHMFQQMLTNADPGITVKGSVIIDSRGYYYMQTDVLGSSAYQDSDPFYSWALVNKQPTYHGEVRALATDDAALQPYLDNFILGTPVTSPENLASLASALQHNDAFITAIGVNNRGYVQAMLSVPKAWFVGTPLAEVKEWMQELGLQYGIAAWYASYGKLDDKDFTGRAMELHRDGVILDGVSYDGQGRTWKRSLIREEFQQTGLNYNVNPSSSDYYMGLYITGIPGSSFREDTFDGLQQGDPRKAQKPDTVRYVDSLFGDWISIVAEAPKVTDEEYRKAVEGTWQEIVRGQLKVAGIPKGVFTPQEVLNMYRLSKGPKSAADRLAWVKNKLEKWVGAEMTKILKKANTRALDPATAEIIERAIREAGIDQPRAKKVEDTMTKKEHALIDPFHKAIRARGGYLEDETQIGSKASVEKLMRIVGEYRGQVKRVQAYKKQKIAMIREMADKKALELALLLAKDMKVTKEKPVTPETARTGAAAKERSALETARGLVQGVEADEYTFRRLDGYLHHGSFWSTIYRPINDGTNYELNAMDSVQSALIQKIRDLKLNEQDAIGTKRRVDSDILPQGITLSPEDMMGVYLHAKNPKNLHHILLDVKDASHRELLKHATNNQFSEQEILNIIAALTDEEIKLADWMQAIRQLDGLLASNVTWDSQNKTLLKEPNYWHIRRLGRNVTIPDLAAELEQQKLSRSTRFLARTEQGWKQARAYFAGNPIHLEAIQEFLKAEETIQHYIAIQPVLDMLNRITGNADFKNAYIAHEGETGYQQLLKYLVDVGTPDLSTGVHNQYERFLRWMRGNAATALLGFRAAQMLKAGMSWWVGAAYIHMGPAIKGLLTYASHRHAVETIVKGLSPQVRDRSMEREIAEAKIMKSIDKRLGGKQSFREWSMLFMVIGDRTAVMSIWIGKFNDYLNKNPKASDQEAASEADEAIRLTQAAWNIKDLAEIHRSGALMALLMMFTNEITRHYNFLKDSFGDYAAGKRERAAGLGGADGGEGPEGDGGDGSEGGDGDGELISINSYVAADGRHITLGQLAERIIEIIIIQGLLMGALGRGFKFAKTVGEGVLDIIEQMLNIGVPVLGRYIVQGIEGYTDNTPAGLKAIDLVSRTSGVIATDVRKIFTGAPVDVPQLLIAVGEMIGFIKGLPVQGVKDIIKYWTGIRTMIEEYRAYH